MSAPNRVQKSIALRPDQVQTVTIIADVIEKHGSFSRVVQDMIDRCVQDRKHEIEAALQKESERAA